MQNDPERLQSSFLRSLSLLGLLSAAVYSLMFGLAEPLTRIVLGPGWEPALPTLRALTLLGFLWVMMNPLGSLAMALGRAGTGFWLNALVIGANAAAVLMGSQFGILGAATGMVLATLLLSPIDFYLLWRWIGLSPAKAIREAGWPLLPGAVTAVTLTLIGMTTRGLPAWLSLLQGTVAGMAAFTATAWAFRGQRLKDALSELLIKLKGN
jgi:O-antigen/teichoic acid export membrane protein